MLRALLIGCLTLAAGAESGWTQPSTPEQRQKAGAAETATQMPARVGASGGTVAGRVDFSKGVGRVDGFGLSEAFGQGAELRALEETKRNEVLDLLLNRRTGAGLTMVRLGIGTDQELEGAAPAGERPWLRSPEYRFDGVDGGQVWFAQEAQRYGVRNFLADAWTAPAFMKTNQRKMGGALCGLPQTQCGGADWTRGFTEELLRYVRSYGELGVRIGSLGFLNEADIGVGYASMRFTADQAQRMMEVFGPMVRAEAPGLKITCCDVSRWDSSRSYVEFVEAKQGRYLDIVTAHEYGRHADEPVKTEKPVWMTEWSSSASYFNPQWDCGGCVDGPDGMTLARDVVEAFAKGHVNAYVVWWGNSSLPAGLIHTANGDYTVAKRFYALTGMSRFVRPGADRVEVDATSEDLDAVGFRNPDGSRVLVLVNRGARTLQLELALDATTAGGGVRSFVTDNAHSLEEMGVCTMADGLLTVGLRRRSMTTVILEPARVTGAARLTATETLTRFGDGSYGGEVRIENTGPGTAEGVRLERLHLGRAAGETEPQGKLGESLGALAPGGWMVWPVNYGVGAGRPGDRVNESVAGQFDGGRFGVEKKVTLP